MEQNTTKITVTPWMDISSFLEDHQLKSINLGPAGAVFLMTCDPLPPNSKYQHSATGNRTRHRIPTAYQIHDLTYGITYQIPPQFWNYHHVQPMPDGQFLLVCGRHSKDPNAHIYDHDGNSLREITLGDAIEDVQTTLEGSIWASYFDKAFTWAQTCLIKYDAEGNIVHRFLSPVDEIAMLDCYALNVVSEEEVWCYAYIEFPLVNVIARDYWHSPVRGARAVAIDHDLVLFPDGYTETSFLHLYELGLEHSLKELARIQLHTPDDAVLSTYGKMIVARGDVILILDGTKLYRIAIKDLL